MAEGRAGRKPIALTLCGSGTSAYQEAGLAEGRRADRPGGAERRRARRATRLGFGRQARVRQTTSASCDRQRRAIGRLQSVRRLVWRLIVAGRQPAAPRRRRRPPHRSRSEPPPLTGAATCAPQRKLQRHGCAAAPKCTHGPAPVATSVAAVAKPEGKFRIQVGMVRTQDEAQSLAARSSASTQRRWPTREPEIDQAVVGNMGSFYRVRVGPVCDAAGRPGRLRQAERPGHRLPGGRPVTAVAGTKNGNNLHECYGPRAVAAANRCWGLPAGLASAPSLMTMEPENRVWPRICMSGCAHACRFERRAVRERDELQTAQTAHL